MTVTDLGVPSLRRAACTAPADRPAGRHLRPRRHRPAGVADRPVQSALHLLHARRGPGLAARRPAAAHRRADPAAAHRGHPARHHQRAVHRRRAVGVAAPRGRRRGGRRAATPARDRPDHQRNRAGRAGRRAEGAPAWTGSTSRWTPSTPSGSPQITRRDRLADVLAGLAAAADGGPGPGQGQRRAGPGHRARRRGGAAAVLPRARIPAAHHRADAAGRRPPVAARRDDRRRRRPDARCARHFDLRPTRRRADRRRRSCGGSTAVPGTVGVIASVSEAFCSACDRTRLTADGQVRSCLFSREETDLRALLRDGADDDAVEAAWRAAMWAKPAGHGINDPDFVQPDRPMSAIGG